MILIIIFSNSGVNQLPIEIGKIAKKKRLFVITVLSIKYTQIHSLQNPEIKY